MTDIATVDIKNQIDIENFSRYSIPSYIPANTIEIVGNKFISRCVIPLSIAILYINENTLEIRARSPILPIDKNIEIDIYSYDQTKYECIVLTPNSNLYYYYSRHIVSIYLYPMANLGHFKIPLSIFQTDETSCFKSEHHLNAFLNIIEKNPQYSYYFYNSSIRKQWLYKHFDIATNTSYDRLFPGAYRADLFRYAYLYLNGGIYIDNKFFMFQQLSSIIDNTDIVLVKDVIPNSYYNAFICSSPHRKEFLEIIQAINYNINHGIAKCTLSITGPKLFYKIFKKYSTVLSHIIPDKSQFRQNPSNHLLIDSRNNSIACYCFYKDYYSKKIYNGGYDRLFHMGLLFRSKPIDLGNYIGYFEPSQYEDRFSAIIINNQLVIKRVDSEQAWGQNLNILLVNKETGIEQTINIGNSPYSTKQIPIMF
jgi:hypothetical protein